jgi:sugar lactone lactonase YvrE
MPGGLKVKAIIRNSVIGVLLCTAISVGDVRAGAEVAEILSSGEAHPFPNDKVNMWEPSLTPMDHFVCVQSVYVDNDNFLWILDPANPAFQGVVEMGAKLMKVNLERTKITMTILLDSKIAPENSYLNDIRVDTKRKHAYITESGTGAIVVVNLESGKPRRVLYDHPSTKAEDITLTIEDMPFEAKVHADGLALGPDGKYLYYQALTGRTLYRIETKALRDEKLSEEKLGEKVERVGESGASDAIAFGPDGYIYLTSLEYNAIRRITPEGVVDVAVQDDRLKWPDSFAIGSDGTIYVTTAQIHLGSARTDPYRLFKLVPREAPPEEEGEAP